jgi:hypothetical protein
MSEMDFLSNDELENIDAGFLQGHGTFNLRPEQHMDEKNPKVHAHPLNLFVQYVSGFVNIAEERLIKKQWYEKVDKDYETIKRLETYSRQAIEYAIKTMNDKKREMEVKIPRPKQKIEKMNKKIIRLDKWLETAPSAVPLKSKGMDVKDHFFKHNLIWKFMRSEVIPAGKYILTTENQRLVNLNNISSSITREKTKYAYDENDKDTPIREIKRSEIRGYTKCGPPQRIVNAIDIISNGPRGGEVPEKEPEPGDKNKTGSPRGGEEHNNEPEKEPEPAETAEPAGLSIVVPPNQPTVQYENGLTPTGTGMRFIGANSKRKSKSKSKFNRDKWIGDWKARKICPYKEFTINDFKAFEMGTTLAEQRDLEDLLSSEPLERSRLDKLQVLLEPKMVAAISMAYDKLKYRAHINIVDDDETFLLDKQWQTHFAKLVALQIQLTFAIAPKIYTPAVVYTRLLREETASIWFFKKRYKKKHCLPDPDFFD